MSKAFWADPRVYGLISGRSFRSAGIAMSLWFVEVCTIAVDELEGAEDDGVSRLLHWPGPGIIAMARQSEEVGLAGVGAAGLDRAEDGGTTEN